MNTLTQQYSYSVYQLTSPSGKRYIGYTSLPVNKRFGLHISNWKRWIKNQRPRSGGCTKLFYAFDAYSPQLWTVSTVAMFRDKADALQHEIQTIQSLNTMTEGYNTTPGGAGGAGKKLTEEHKRNLSLARKKYYETADGQEWLANLTQRMQTDNPSKKRPPSTTVKKVRVKKGTEEYSQLLSQAQKTRWANMTEEQRANHTNAKIGRKQTDKQKAAAVATHAKTFLVQFPDGSVHEVYNLSAFSREHGLRECNLHSSSSKGYRLVK